MGRERATLLALALGVMLGCAPQYPRVARPGWISQLAPLTPTRRLASEPASCRSQELAPERVRARVQSGFGASEFRSTWVSRYGKFFARDAEEAGNWAQCADDPVCAITETYRQAYAIADPADGGPARPSSPRGDEADLVLDFALGMGAVPATDAREAGAASTPRARVLFTASELVELQKLRWKLPEVYSRLWNLRALMKLPFPLSPGGAAADASPGVQDVTRATRGRDVERTVEYAPGVIRFGYLGLLTDGTWRGTRYETDMAKTAVHELTHQADLALENETRELTRFSESSLWLQAGEWKAVTSRDAQGHIQMQWQSTAAKNTFTREYARKSPAEDFADSAAFYRLDPERLKHADRKRVILREWLFSGRDYLPAEFRRVGWEQADLAVREALPDLLGRCANQPGCLSGAVTEALRGEVARLRQKEWEGCDHFNDAEVGRTLPTLVKKIISELGDDLNDATILSQWRASRQELAQSFDAREAALSCMGDKRPEDCFDRVRDQVWEAYVSRLNVLPESLQSFEKELFLKQRSYFSALREASAAISSWLDPHAKAFLDESHHLWLDCQFARDPVSDPPMTPFLGPPGYIHPSVRQCLNTQIELRVKTILLRSTQGRVQWPSTAAVSEVTTRAVSRFNAFLLEEARFALAQENSDWGELRERAFSGRSIPRDAADCTARVEAELKTWWTSAARGPEPGTIFHDPNQALLQWASDSCQGL